MTTSHTSKINDQGKADIQTFIKPSGNKRVGIKAKKSWEKNRNV